MPDKVLFNRKNLVLGIASALAFTAAIPAYSDESKVRDAQEEKKSKPVEVEEVVVTGSHIRGLTLSDVTKHVMVYDSEMLKATGESDLGRVLARLPQNFGGNSPVNAFAGDNDGGIGGINEAKNYTGASTVNLRGLGSENTLILLNGKRLASSGQYGGYQDVSSIPLSSIERIEIMMDGASTIYGADAIGGVINIIQKKDYETLQTDMRYDAPTSGGYGEWAFNLTGGFTWDTGSLMTSYQRRQNSSFTQDEAGYVNGSTGRGFGGGSVDLDNLQFTGDINGDALFDNPPTIQFDSDPDNIYRVSGEGRPEGMGDLEEWSFSGGQADASMISLMGDRKSDSISLYLNQEVGDSITAFGNLLYNKSSNESMVGAAGRYAVSLAADSEFNPFGEAVTVSGVYPVLGVNTISASSETYQMQLGFDWDLGADWRLNWSGSYGNNKTMSNRYRALREDLGDAAGYFNPWGDGSDNNQKIAELVDENGNPMSVLEYLRAGAGSNYSNSTGDEFLTEAKLDGVLLALPAGDVHLAVGAQYGRNTLDQVAVNELAAGGVASPSAYDAVDVGRHQRAVFAELNIPVVSDDNALPGIQSLTFNASARAERYKHFGQEPSTDSSGGPGEFNPSDANGQEFKAQTVSYGMVWEPVDSVRVRANYNESFTPPSLVQLFAPQLELNAPCHPLFGCFVGSGIARASAEELAEWGFRPLFGGGWVQDKPYVLTTGGNPDLEAQFAETESIAVDFMPLDELRLTANWHRINYRDKIVRGQDLVSSLESPWKSFPDLYSWDEDGNLVGINWSYANVAAEEQTGLDYLAEYSRYTDWGDFRITANYSKMLDFKQKLVEGATIEAEDYIGRRIPRRSAQLGGSWTMGSWYAAFDSSYRGKTSAQHYGRFDSEGELRQMALTTASLWQTNAHVGYTFSNGIMDGVELRAGINNLFNKRPETKVTVDGKVPTAEDGTTPISHNSTVANPLGQMWWLSVKKEF